MLDDDDVLEFYLTELPASDWIVLGHGMLTDVNPKQPIHCIIATRGDFRVYVNFIKRVNEESTSVQIKINEPTAVCREDMIEAKSPPIGSWVS